MNNELNPRSSLIVCMYMFCAASGALVGFVLGVAVTLLVK